MDELNSRDVQTKLKEKSGVYGGLLSSAMLSPVSCTRADIQLGNLETLPRVIISAEV
jgi:hypothetical protein